MADLPASFEPIIDELFGPDYQVRSQQLDERLKADSPVELSTNAGGECACGARTCRFPRMSGGRSDVKLSNQKLSKCLTPSSFRGCRAEVPTCFGRELYRLVR